MKINKIPFDPKYISQPEIEFETRCGYKAMFVGMSKFDKSKYIFEIYCPDRDRNIDSIAYDPDGINPGGNSNYDLFMILPEPELTKLQSSILEVFDNIITDYDLDISQSQESRLEYVERIKKAFIEELRISREELSALENILDYVPESDNLDIVEGLLQKLKEYETK